MLQSPLISPLSFFFSQKTSGRLTDSGFKCCVDQYCRYIIVHIYYGLLTVIPIANVGSNSLDMNGSWSFSNVIVEEMEILDICSLYAEETPTISIFFRVLISEV